MGMFDYRCALTGLATAGGRVVAFWVWKSGKTQWTNATLPVRGSYDGYGRVENIDADFNTRLLESSWNEAVESGHLTLAREAEQEFRENNTTWDRRPRLGIERIFAALERGTTVEPGMVAFAGAPLCQMLVDERVYDAVVKNAPSAPPPKIAELFPNLLGQTLYADLDRAPAAKGRLGELATFGRFFAQHARWRPGSADEMIGQYGRVDELATWLQARRTFVKSPWLVEALHDEVLRRADDPGDELNEEWYANAEPTASWLGLCAGGAFTACSSVAALRQAVEEQVIAGDAKALHGAPLYVLAVNGGLLHQELDLGAIARLQRGDQRVPWADELAPAFLAREGEPATVLLNWDEIELKLPKLDEPAAPKGTLRFLPVTTRDSKWLGPNDRWRSSIDFGAAR